MKGICVVMSLLAIVAAGSCTGKETAVPEQFVLPVSADLTKADLARILSELPIQEEHMREVYDAVHSSSGNGYDEEYMMADLFSTPGSGVGSTGKSTKTQVYANPLRNLFEEYFEANSRTKSGSCMQSYVDAITNGQMQIYWPYSDNWDGSYPIITYDPGYGADSNTGYEITLEEDGSRKVREVIVDETVAATRTVWVINKNDDCNLSPTAFTVKGTAAAAVSDGDTGKKKLMLRRFMMLRNFDSWFGGGSEFFIKCGSASGFKATSLEDLQLYTPSVTDFMIVVKRSQLKKDIDINTIIVTDFSDAIDKMAFLIVEDDGGTTTSWKCSATVKYKSKSYGFEMEIPYKDKDDIVWRGQLSGDYFTEGEEVTGRFGDVMVTFALE